MTRITQAPSATVTPRRRSPFSFSTLSISTILKSLGTLAVAICLSVLATGGTYAFLNSSQPVPVGPSSSSIARINSGTTGLVVNSAVITLGGFYPGVTQKTDFSVTASGSADLNLSVASITGQGTNGLAISVSPGTCAAAGTAISTGSLGVKAVAVTTYDAATTPAATVPLCLIVSMPMNAPASAASSSTAVSVNLTGVQP